MRLALDAMGGDLAPRAPVEGAALYLKDRPDDELLLVGDEAKVHKALAQVKLARPERLSVCHAPEVVEMGDAAASSIRRKKGSSLRICFEKLKSREVDAVVSAGHSGAVMAGALLVLGRLAGVDRPAFAALFPTLRPRRRCLLLDAGANVDCTSGHLVQFALMGEAYVRRVVGQPRPRVALLSNGEEDSKGTALTREALAALRKLPIDFAGYVEGKDLFSGEVDVVVTDGFTGNVVLKTSEGTAAAVTGLLRSAIERAGVGEKLGAMLLATTFAGLRKVVDWAEYGGAPLLGVAGVGIVAHGRSSARAICSALDVARATVAADLQGELAAAIAAAPR